jgi:hypothetical protein
MPWYGSHRFAFTERAIYANAPGRSGVYALFDTEGRCISVGESEDIQARLLQLTQGVNPCVARERPSLYAWELVAPEQREMRRDQLKQEFRPVCEP